jgi:hypothetical protein
MQGMPADWDEALALLGEVLESRRAEPYHLVVCGGAALRAVGVVSRVTKDVDVLASRGEVDGEIGSAWPLPESLKDAAAGVAEELGLPADWLNASASLLVGPLNELPAELWSDLREVGYGPRLRISYLGRGGLIPLKFHAGLGRDEPRDLDDLRALAPTAAECERALHWLRRTTTIDPARQRRLEEILEHLGHGHD